MSTSKFISIMDKIGEDIKVVWADVVKYLPEAAGLATLLFPAEAAGITGVVNSVSLIQQAITTVEQKFAATGNPTGTGPQKLAQVISMVGPTVTSLLTAEGLNYNSAQVTNIINAVVAVLNVQQAPATVAPVAAA
jgi:hypothetical protein